ncbi:hypothetical protein Bca52824_045586 [Brassica carinata]|uniref:Uncharacterized protein n=1 Tax=Brassica carinata TaxID=52824 RepID=A0A8X7RDG8_BRACI|nr:hypothetical protein Bca52824_045586 [Brassica carinata]
MEMEITKEKVKGKTSIGGIASKHGSSRCSSTRRQLCPSSHPGFLLGFVFLIRPQYGYFNQRNNNPRGYAKSKHKPYQYDLWITSLLLLVAGYTVGLVVLLRGTDLNKHCSWCHISAVFLLRCGTVNLKMFTVSSCVPNYAADDTTKHLIAILFVESRKDKRLFT